MESVTTPGRRRGQALVNGIRDAVLQELGEAGYGGFSIERVAARAGTGKASIYRRWSDKDELILDTVRGGVPGGIEPTYSGDVRADLLAMLQGMARGFQTPIGAALRALLAETHRRPALLEALHDTIFDPGARELRAVLRAAANAGEIDAAVVERDIVTIGHEMLTFRFITTGHVTPDEILRIVDELLMPVLQHPSPPTENA